MTGAAAGVLGRSLLRVLGSDGGTAGLALLVAPDVAVTTAAVIGRATAGGEGGPLVERALPTAGHVRRRTEAVVDSGPGPVARDGQDHVLVLRLDADAVDAHPAPLLAADGAWGRRVQLFGYPPGVPDGAWSAGVLRDGTALGWHQLDPDPGGYPHSSGFAGTGVWDDEAGAVVGLLSVPGSEVIPARHLVAGVPELRGLVEARSPFPGLPAYTEEDSATFFGRSAEAQDVAARLRTERWITVVGDSGVGKSSLALAGVVPLLRAAGYGIVVAGPTGEHLESVHARVRESARTRSPLLVVLDQAEQLFSEKDGPDDTVERLFGDELPPGVRVLTTARSDLVGRLLDDDCWRRLARSPHLYPLAPLGAEELRGAITLPLAATSVRYEPGLVDEILADTEQASAPMPLLGHVLQQLWRARTDGLITHAAYRALGGVAGSVARHAESVWTGLEAARAAEDARLLLIRLVDLRTVDAAPVRRPADVARLTAGQRRAAQYLTAEHLVVTREVDGTTFVELAHEEILRSWHRLAAWIEQDRALLIWRNGVRRDAARWVAAGRDAALLPGLAALDQAPGEQTAGLEQDEMEFLAAARGAHHARRRSRARRRTAFVLVAAAMTALAVVASLNGVQARERGRLADSRALAHFSQDVQQSDPVLAVMTSIAAYERAPTHEARDQLMRGYMRHAYLDRIVVGEATAVTDMTQSLDGDVVLTSHESGRVVLTLGMFSGSARTVLLPGVEQVSHILLAENGRRAVLVDSDGRGVWFEIDPDAPDPVGPWHPLPDPDVARTDLERVGGDFGDATMEDLHGRDVNVDPAISPDGRYVAARVWGRVVWWDLEQGEDGTVVSTRPVVDKMRWDLTFGGDPDTLIARVEADAGYQAGTRLVALDRSGTGSRDVTPTAPAAEVSRDGKVALICREGRGDQVVVTRYSTATGDRLPGSYRGTGETGCFGSLGVVDRAGQRMYVDGELWDFGSGRAVSSPGSFPTSVAPATATRHLVERGTDLFYLRAERNALVTYDVPKSGTLELDDAWTSIVTDDGSTQVAVVDGGARLVAVPADEDGSVEPLAEADRLEPRWDYEHGDRLVFSRDGRYLLGREGRNIVTVRDAGTLELVSTVTAEPPEVYEPEPDLGGSANPGPVLFGDVTSDFAYWFDHAGHVVTVSDTVVQLWDARTGEEAARYDVSELQPEDDPDPLTVVNTHPEAGKVLVTTFGQSGTAVVDVIDGRVTETIETPDSTVTVQLDPRGESMAVLRTGARMDLYSRDPVRRLSGPYDLDGDIGTFRVYGFDDRGRFVVAQRDSLRVLEPGTAGPVDSYEFGDPLDGSDAVGGFQQVTSNLEHLVRLGSEDSPYSGVLHLDPETWQEHLCEVIGGRDFTADEIGSLPVPVRPGEICTSGQDLR